MPTAVELRHAIEAAATISGVVETEILERIPWVFQGDADAFVDWRKSVAREISLRPNSVYLVGSAAVGYSLSP